MEIQTHSTTPDSVALEHDTHEDAVEPAETRPQLVRAAPPVDIFENTEELMLRVDLPGVPKDGVDLRVEHGRLSLEAMHTARGVVYRRAFTLPDIVDSEQVEASLEEGVLTIRLRKREDAKPRRIPVHTR